MPLSERGKKSPQLQQLRWKRIPSSTEWATASALSSVSLFESRNSSELRAIDSAVAEYERISKLPKLPLAQESEALIKLFESVEVYRATPRSHRKSRWNAVSDLRAITLFVLSDIRWQKYKDVTGGHKPGMKPMIEHVWSEKHSPGHARVGHGADANQEPDPWLRGEVEEKYLFEYLRKVRRDDGNVQDGVKYVEDEERWNYQVVFREDGTACQRFVQQKGVIIRGKLLPITTGGGDLGTCIYVVDEDDNFYFEPVGQQGQSLNHCSFLAGRPVKCAGTIGITQGIVGYIDNASGHYQPSRKNLVRGLEALKKRAGALIFPWVLVRDRSGRYPNAAYEADKFLLTKGNCMPVGYYKDATGRYDKNLTRFNGGADLTEFMAQQEKGIDRAKAAARFKALATKIEMNAKTKGTLANDDERQIIKEAAMLELAPKTMLEAYCAKDPVMKSWLARNYNIKVPVNA